MLKASYNPFQPYSFRYYFHSCFFLIQIFPTIITSTSMNSVSSCAHFHSASFPRVTVKYGDHNSSESFELDESQLIDHDTYFIKCSAKYPIEWIANDMSVPSNRHVSAHLHVSRVFTNFFDRSTYKFIITTKVRYKKGNYNEIGCTCRSTVNPHCLATTITSREIQNRISFNISTQAASDAGLATFSGSIDDPDDTGETCDYKIFYNQAEDSKVAFLCEIQEDRLESMKFFSVCSNAMSCLNQYRKYRLSPNCVLPLEKNTSLSGNGTCVGCDERHLSQGIVGCDSSSEGKKLFFFSSISRPNSPSKIYFRRSDVNPQDMLHLNPVPSEIYIGYQITISCSVSNYYFARGAVLALKYSNLPGLVFKKSTLKIYDVDLSHQYDKTTTEYTISITNTSLERIYCFAPVWNSFEWVNQSLPVRVQFRLISGHVIIAVTVTIFVTALLVATMFGLLWIKVGKMGRMSLLTTSEIDEFHRGSVAEDHYVKGELAYGTSAVYDPVYEIRRDRLLLDETDVLGHGHFGLVLKGIVKDSQRKVRIEVAVKTVKTKADVGSLKALLTELKILASIGKHTNVVNLVGACTRRMSRGEVYVAVEFCANGNLQNFLRRRRTAFRSQLDNDILVIETPIRKLCSSSEFLMTIDLIRWAWEIAKGMEFLTSKKVIHGDLATRNILLTEDFVVKVSDFGMSRQLVDYYYVQKETGPMPWKWMSLESLREYKFSIQSDIWSFGVVLWELFTLGDVPYAGCSWSAEFLQTLASGGRLGRPKNATTEMYDLMRECWKNDPAGRPSFFAVRMFFEDILTQCTSQDYIQIQLQSVSAASHHRPEEDHNHHFPLLNSRIIIEEDEEGEDDVFE